MAEYKLDSRVCTLPSPVWNRPYMPLSPVDKRAYMAPCRTVPGTLLAEQRPKMQRQGLEEFFCVSSPPNVDLESRDDVGTARGELDSDLMNAILHKKSFSTERLTEILNNSILKLIHTVLKGNHVDSIQGSIMVSLSGNKTPIIVGLNERYRSEELLYPCKDLSSERVSDSNCTRLLSLPLGEEMSYAEELTRCENYSPPYRAKEMLSPQASPEVREQDFRLRCSPHSILSDDSEKIDSEEESGYSSSERESVSEKVTKEHNMDKKFSKSNNDTESSLLSVDDIGYQEYLNTEDSNNGDSFLVIDLGETSEEIPMRDVDNIDNRSSLMEDSFDEVITMTSAESAEIEMKTDCLTDDENTCSNSSPTRSCACVECPIDLSGYCKTSDNVPCEEQKTQEVISEGLSSMFVCKKCPGYSGARDGYQDHMLEAHQLHACTICSKDFSSKNNLKRHIRIHTGQRPYKCKQCDMSFSRRDDLKGHVLKHDYNKPFRCSLCKKGYTDRTCVKNHMSKEHCSRLMHICPQCGESFDREDTYLEHRKSHPSLKQFSCSKCSFVGINHLMALKHQLLHSHKLFSCKPCNAYFADPFGYTKHVRKHKKAAEYKSYVCCFCDTTLPTYDQFVRHEYSHAQGKVHECSDCKKQFRSKSLMLEHCETNSCTDGPSAAQCEYLQHEIKIEKDIETDMEHTHVSNDEKELPPLCFSLLRDVDPADTVDRQSPGLQDKHGEGELLDLSFKSAFRVTASHNGTVVDTNPPSLSINADIPAHGVLNLANNSVPRNGCAANKNHIPEQGKSALDCSLVGNSLTSNRFPVANNSPSHDQERKDMAEKTDPNLISKLLSQNKVALMSSSNPRIGYRDSRVHPYSKMIDLAAKFIRARGSDGKSKLLKESGNVGISLNMEQITSTGESRNRKMPALIQTDVKPNEQIRELDPATYLNKESGRIGPMPNNNAVVGLFGSKPYHQTHNSTESSQIKSVVEKSMAEEEAEKLYSYRKLAAVRPPPIVGCLVAPEGRRVGSSHILKLPSKRRAECDICHERFESFFQLESHSVVTHHRYLCEFCGKAFTARPNRDRHVRFHTGERPYKCDLCPSAFFRGDDLKNHRTTIHPTEHINCNRCSASFTWQKDLERHLRHSKCVI